MVAVTGKEATVKQLAKNVLFTLLFRDQFADVSSLLATVGFHSSSARWTQFSL